MPVHRINRYWKLHAVLSPQLLVLLCESEDLGGSKPFFQAEEIFLEFQSQSESSQAAVRTNNSVAGDDDEQRIAAHRLAYAPVSLMFQSVGERFVGGCLAVRDFSRFQPNFSVVRSSDNEVEGEGCEVFFLALEISFKKSFFLSEWLVIEFERDSLFFKVTFDLFEVALVLDERSDAQSLIGLGQENFPARDVQDRVKHRRYSDPQSEPFCKSRGQSCLQYFSLGFSDFILHAVELNFFCIRVVDGKGGSVVPVPGLPDGTRVNEVLHALFEFDFVAVSRQKGPIHHVIFLRVDKRKVSVAKKAEWSGHMSECLCGIEFAEDIVVFIKRCTVANQDMLMDSYRSLFQVAEVFHVFFPDVFLCPVNGCGRDWIKGLDRVMVTDSFIMVAPDYGKRFECAHLLDDFIGVRTVSDQVAEKNVVVDLSFLGKFQKNEQGFQVSVDIGEDQIAHLRLFFPV